MSMSQTASLSNIKHVLSDAEFPTHLDSSGDALVVVDFFTTWCGPCKKMEQPLKNLAQKYPKVVFLKVDADQCFETAMIHKLKGVPLFVFYRKSTLLDMVQGYQPQVLEAKVALAEEEFARHLEYLKTHPEPAVKPRDLKTHLNLPSCSVMNDMGESGMESFLMGNAVSSKGAGRILFYYEFKELVKLEAFTIKAAPERGTRLLRFFVNHPKIPDIHKASDYNPTQEITLSREDMEGDRSIRLRVDPFMAVKTLQVFFLYAPWKGQSNAYRRVDIEDLTLQGFTKKEFEENDNQNQNQNANSEGQAASSKAECDVAASISPPEHYLDQGQGLGQGHQGQGQGQGQTGTGPGIASTTSSSATTAYKDGDTYVFRFKEKPSSASQKSKAKTPEPEEPTIFAPEEFRDSTLAGVNREITENLMNLQMTMNSDLGPASGRGSGSRPSPSRGQRQGQSQGQGQDLPLSRTNSSLIAQDMQTFMVEQKKLQSLSVSGSKSGSSKKLKGRSSPGLSGQAQAQAQASAVKTATKKSLTLGSEKEKKAKGHSVTATATASSRTAGSSATASSSASKPRAKSRQGQGIKKKN